MAVSRSAGGPDVTASSPTSPPSPPSPDLPVFDPEDELMEAVHVLEAGFVCHREDDEEPVPCPHVLLPHCTELLLAGCVQHCGHRGTKNTFLKRKNDLEA